MQNRSKSKILSAILILGIVINIISFDAVYAQTPEGSVVNSKYLTISDQRWRDGDFSDQITGTIVNNSTDEVGSIQVHVGLYDSAGNLITMESGYADVSPLPPADDSSFSISLFGLNDESVAKYILYASGLPSAF